MKYIKLLTIHVEGFRSYIQPVSYNFQSVGLHVVSGENGAGKTTLFSALTWGLFKTNLYDTTNDAVQTRKNLRYKGYKGTRVMIQFRTEDHKYLVVRHLNYKGSTIGLEGNSSFIILKKKLTDKTKWCDSHIVGDALYKKDQQEYLNQVLGLTSRAFTNSILFGQRMARLVGAKGEDKRALFEEFFELFFIEEAKENAKQELAKSITNINTLALSVNSVDHKKQMLEVRKMNEQEKEATWEKNRKERLDSLLASYNSYKKSYESLQKDIESHLATQKKSIKKDIGKDLPALMAAANKAEEVFNQAEIHFKKATRELADTDNGIANCDKEAVKLAGQLRNLSDKCPTCGGKLKDIDKSKASLQEQIKQQEKAILTYRMGRAAKHEDLQVATTTKAEKSKAYHDAILAYNEAKTAAKPVDDPLPGLEARKASAVEFANKMAKEYKQVKAQEQLESKIPDIEKELAQVDKNHAAKTKELEVLTKKRQKIEWWINTGFAAKGMSSFIFSAMLTKLNNAALKYAAYFGYAVKFSIDMEKASKPFITRVFQGEEEIDYKDLSGGEKQRCDLVLCFAMNDLVTSKTKFNIMILDEVFENLTAKSVALVNTVIDQKARNTGVYLITHNMMHVSSPLTTLHMIKDEAGNTTIV